MSGVLATAVAPPQPAPFEQLPPPPPVPLANPLEAPKPAADPTPPAPSIISAAWEWISGSIGAFAKPLAVVLIGLIAYGTYQVVDRRRPYEWAGTVEARTVSLGSRTGGRVKTVLVREGDEVKAGQPILIIDEGDLAAQLAIAEAELEAAEAHHEKLANGARPEEIAQAQARVAEARLSGYSLSTQAARDASEAARARTLAKAGALSAAEQERVLAQARAGSGSAGAAAARAKEAEASLRLLIGGTRPEDLRAAKAAVAGARAKVALISGQIAELTLRAPSNVRIETIAVRPGDILAPNATAASVLESGQLYVRIYVPETLIGKIAVGQKLPISVDSFPGRTFPGHVEHINHVGEFTPRSLQTVEERTDQVFAARISIAEGASDLRAGMVAFAKVEKR